MDGLNTHPRNITPYVVYDCRVHGPLNPFIVSRLINPGAGCEEGASGDEGWAV